MLLPIVRQSYGCNTMFGSFAHAFHFFCNLHNLFYKRMPGADRSFLYLFVSVFQKHGCQRHCPVSGWLPVQGCSSLHVSRECIQYNYLTVGSQQPVQFFICIMRIDKSRKRTYIATDRQSVINLTVKENKKAQAEAWTFCCSLFMYVSFCVALLVWILAVWVRRWGNTLVRIS